MEGSHTPATLGARVRKMRLLLASSDDLHVLPLAALVPLLSTDFDCEHIRLDSRASDATNLARLRTQLEDGANPECTLLGGFSRGARLAAMLSLEISVRGLVGLSFPFHRHGRPAEHHGLDVLKKVLLPTLIIQGTRDSHGNRAGARNGTIARCSSHSLAPTRQSSLACEGSG